MSGLFTTFPTAISPLTGSETFPADTNQLNGAYPETEKIQLSQLTSYFGTQPSNSSILNFYAYSPTSIGSTADVTTVLQNFLLYCQLVALTLKTSALDDQAQRVFVTAYLPRGDYYISSPIIIPELVNLKCDGLILRKQSGLNILSNYTGNTSSGALGNAYMPSVICVPRGHCETLNLLCNPDSSNIQGAGFFVGKNWSVASFAIGLKGTGYQVNDVLTCAQPSLSPYIAATATVTSVDASGRITGINSTPTNSGAYALPPVLQTQQWTSANGFNVFDLFGNFLTTGGRGSGATLTPTWTPDFSPNVASYSMGTGGLIADTVLGNIRIAHVGTTTDTNYGPMIGFRFYGLNIEIDSIEVQGGKNGLDFSYGSDVRAKSLNPVASSNPLVLYNTTNFICNNCVFDTPSGSVLIDISQGITLKGRIFYRNLNDYPGAPSATPATIQVGQYSSGLNINIGMNIEFLMDLAGAGNATTLNAGCPAMALAQTTSSRFKLIIDNTIGTYSGSEVPLITSYVAFGSNVDPSCVLEGSINYISTNYPTPAIFSGTNPGCAINIWSTATSNYVGTNQARSNIAGLTLSNDATTPNSVIDISAGTAVDSTNFYTMTASNFTKSTAGSWAVGNGSNGMGNGLTIANSTWYHVFMILNGVSVDYYFDTSATAANAPSGTIAFRRIGSFKTNGSAQILSFKQDEETFYWGVATLDVNGTSIPTGARTLVTLNVPTGVKVRPIIRFSCNNNSAITSPDEPDGLNGSLSTAPGYDINSSATPGTAWAGSFLYSNTSAQVGISAYYSTGAAYVVTRGWIDSRGRFN